MTSLLHTKDDLVIRSIFVHYDRDNDNALTFNEFKELCADLGFEVQKFQFSYVTSNDNNKITYNEFREWWRKEDKLKILLEENVDNVYYAYDMYIKGIQEYKVLNYENFNKFLEKYYNCTISIDEFKQYNKNGNNNMEFNEFLDWLKWI